MSIHSPKLLTAFLQASFRKTPQEAFYVKRFWIIKDESDYKTMINFVCDIDLIVHPEIKAYPCIYELKNQNGPLLEEVSPIYVRKKIEESMKINDDTEYEISQVFNCWE